MRYFLNNKINMLYLSLVAVIAMSCKATGPKDERSQRGQQAAEYYKQTEEEIAPEKKIEPPLLQCIDAEPVACEIEMLITKYTNELVRRPAGKADIAHNSKISYASRVWSKAMGQGDDGGFFNWFYGGLSHSGFPRERVASYREKFGESVNISRENVAMGPRGQDADAVAREFVLMWKDSSGHYRNMVSNTTELGNGVYYDGTKWWATQIFGN